MYHEIRQIIWNSSLFRLHDDFFPYKIFVGFSEPISCFQFKSFSKQPYTSSYFSLRIISLFFFFVCWNANVHVKQGSTFTTTQRQCFSIPIDFHSFFFLSPVSLVSVVYKTANDLKTHGTALKHLHGWLIINPHLAR